MERSKVVDWIWFGAWTVSKPDLSLSVSMLPYHHQYYVYSMIMASDKCICFVFSLRLFGLVLIPLFLYRLHMAFYARWYLLGWPVGAGIVGPTKAGVMTESIYLVMSFWFKNFLALAAVLWARSIVGATLLLPCVHLEIKDTKFILC